MWPTWSIKRLWHRWWRKYDNQYTFVSALSVKYEMITIEQYDNHTNLERQINTFQKLTMNKQTDEAVKYWNDTHLL